MHFRQLIGSCSLSAARRPDGDGRRGGDWEFTDEWKGYCQFIDECWFQKPEAKTLLEQEFQVNGRCVNLAAYGKLRNGSICWLFVYHLHRMCVCVCERERERERYST